MTYLTMLFLASTPPTSHAGGRDACAANLGDALTATILDHVRTHLAGEDVEVSLVGARRDGERVIEGIVGVTDRAGTGRYKSVLARDDGSVVTVTFRPELQAKALDLARADRARLIRRGQVVDLDCTATMTSRGWRVSLAIDDKGENFAEVYDVAFRPNLDLRARMVEIKFPEGHPAARPPAAGPRSAMGTWWRRLRGG